LQGARQRAQLLEEAGYPRPIEGRGAHGVDDLAALLAHGADGLAEPVPIAPKALTDGLPHLGWKIGEDRDDAGRRAAEAALQALEQEPPKEEVRAERQEQHDQGGPAPEAA